LNGETLKSIAELVNILSTVECLAYQNSTWNIVLDWFRTVINNSTNNVELVGRYLDSELNELLDEASIDYHSSLSRARKLAKLFLMMFDTNQDGVYIKPVSTLMDRLVSCNKYLYMKAHTIERCFFVFDSMLDLVKCNIYFAIIFN
jgi:hypothetical protein